MSPGELKLAPQIPIYHQSHINMFLKCGLQYEFRYIQGLVLPPKSALTVGNAVDTGVTVNLVQKVSSKTDLPLNDVLDACSSDFDKRAVTTVWDGEDPGKYKDVSVKLAQAHHEHIAPKIQPAKVQEKFTIETDAGYGLGGIIDLVEESGIVADTKTSKNKYDADAIHRAIQPAVYDFAYEALRGKKSPGFRYDVLVKPTKTKPAEAQQVEGRVTQADRNFLFETTNTMHKALKAGVFLPAAEGSWWCSKDWCGYWGMCKGKGINK